MKKSTEELTKLAQELFDKANAKAKLPLIVKEVMAINYKPHPFTIGPKHVAHASDYHHGMLGDATIQAIPCAYKEPQKPTCNRPVEEHTHDTVVLFQLTNNITNSPTFRKVLTDTVQPLEQYGVDGLTFLDTKEKYRIK